MVGRLSYRCLKFIYQHFPRLPEAREKREMSDCQGVLGYGMFSLQQSKSLGAILTLSQRMTSKELLVGFAGSLEGTVMFFARRYYL